MRYAEKNRCSSVVLKVIKQCTTQLFLISQGTGVLSVVLYNLDYQFRGLKNIAIIVWLLTIVLAIIFTLTYVIKSCIFPKTIRQEITSNIVEVCCLASASITFSGIVDMFALVCPHSFGPGWGTAAYVLGWISVGVAFVATIGIPYVYLWCIAPGVDGMPPTVLLPAIAAITAGATCGVITFAADISTRAQVPMIIVGYILVGLGLPFGLSLIVIFIARLLNGSWPPRAKTPMTYVIIGPLGQASYALMILGASAASPGPGAFGKYNSGRFITDNDGKVVEAVSILSALILWGYGAFWILFALAESIHLGLFKSGGIKNVGHSVSMWSPIFPIVSSLPCKNYFCLSVPRESILWRPSSLGS